MKFGSSRNDLSELVNRVQNIIAQKTAIPILSNFLLEADGNQLVLTATDYTVVVRVRGSAKVIEPGSTTVPAKRFAQLLKELTSSHVEVSVNDRDIIDIVADSSTFKMKGMSNSHFPPYPDFSDAMQLQMKQGELKDMLFRTSFAVAKDDNRYSLSGVYILASQSSVTFTGTDGRRLARAQHFVELGDSFYSESIVPIKAVDEIMKNLIHEDEVLTLYFMKDKIAVETSDMTIITKLLSGDYPDVDAVIPKQSNYFVVLHREELIVLLRQVSLFVNNLTNSVRFSFENGILNLYADTMDVGEGKVCMPVNYTGERLDIAYSANAFLDLLRHCKKETVTMGFSDRYNPAIFFDGENSSEKEGQNPLFILMPTHLGSEDVINTQVHNNQAHQVL